MKIVQYEDTKVITTKIVQYEDSTV